MTKWEAMKLILLEDAKVFAEQAKSLSAKATLSLDPTDANNLRGQGQLMAFQASAAIHYSDVMDELDRQAAQLQELANDGGESEPNEVAT